MNSYTIPLNPQEKRHATHQGEFKWFIVEMTELYASALKQLGVFSERQLSRMTDATLFSDIVYTMSLGIRSASEASLDKFYQDNDASFSSLLEMHQRLEAALNLILDWQDIHQSSLMKMYNFYTLVLAISHAQAPIAIFAQDFPRKKRARIDSSVALPNLTALSEALEEPSAYPQFAKYVEACSKATNRIEPRKTRFQWLSKALDPKLLL
jgi:hypothetical protein